MNEYETATANPTDVNPDEEKEALHATGVLAADINNFVGPNPNAMVTVGVNIVAIPHNGHNHYRVLIGFKRDLAEGADYDVNDAEIVVTLDDLTKVLTHAAIQTVQIMSELDQPVGSLN